MGIANRTEKRKPLGYPGRIFLWEGEPVDCILLDVSKGGAMLSVDDSGAIGSTPAMALGNADHV